VFDHDEDVLYKDRVRIRPAANYFEVMDTHIQDFGIFRPEEMDELREIDRARYSFVIEHGAGRASFATEFMARSDDEARKKVLTRVIRERIPRSILGRALGRSGRHLIFQAQIQIFFIPGLKVPEPTPAMAEPLYQGAQVPGDLAPADGLELADGIEPADGLELADDIALPAGPGDDIRLADDIALPAGPGDDIKLADDIALPAGPGDDIELAPARPAAGPRKLSARDLIVPAPPVSAEKSARGVAEERAARLSRAESREAEEKKPDDPYFYGGDDGD